MNKQEIVDTIEQKLFSLPNREGLCLYYAGTVMETLQSYGYKALIQGGSLLWPRIKPEEDDGVMDTHFSYMWSPETLESQIAMSLGALPEMHVWVGLIDTQEIVDFSTRHLKEAATNRGHKWIANDPPSYFWGNQLPDWVRYRPNVEASLLALEIWKQSKDNLKTLTN